MILIIIEKLEADSGHYQVLSQGKIGRVFTCILKVLVKYCHVVSS